MSDVVIPGVGEKTFKAISALVNFGKAAKAAIDDGWKPGEDLPALASKAALELLPILADVPGLIEEAKDKDAVLRALACVALLNAKV